MRGVRHRRRERLHRGDSQPLSPSTTFDVCCLFDGSCDYFGISPGFEYPRRLVRDIFLHRQPFQAARQYITTMPGHRTTRRHRRRARRRSYVDRPEMTRLAVHMALIRYLQRRDYERWG